MDRLTIFFISILSVGLMLYITYKPLNPDKKRNDEVLIKYYGTYINKRRFIYIFTFISVILLSGFIYLLINPLTPKNSSFSQNPILALSVVNAHWIFIVLLVYTIIEGQFWWNRFTKKQLKRIENLKQELEVKNNEMTDSIKYAKRIQSALLPPEGYINEILHEYFVFFKPRDIVSGDFYWIKKIKNFVIVVAADCTGHGVPGAFMSMLGISFLNEIVNRSRFDSAGEILNRLRGKVKSALKQEGKISEQKDGMDISLAILDTESLTLQFAGAYNPLYLIRNNNSELSLPDNDSYKLYQQNGTTLYEIKADRQPIAIHLKESEFTTHEIQLIKGDAFYMFSDGFTDQPGGEKNKKFMSKRFKKLLVDIYPEPATQQKVTLENAFEQWRGDEEQIDDVLVIGVRI